MNNVFFPLGRIEVNRQLNALRLVHSEGQVGLLLQVLETETFQVLLSESFSVQNASGGCSVVRITLGRASCVGFLLRGVLLSRASTDLLSTSSVTY